MPTLLTPAFLAGLVALAVPIIVHLVHRQQKQVVEFPSLMFLRKIPYQSVRRQKIRHWLLFALRCLAIILIVLAFARPFLDRGARAVVAPAASAREIVVLLDRSYSMAYEGRWARALSAAGRSIDALGPNDRLTLVGFDQAAAALTERSGDRAVLKAALGSLAPGDGITRYEPALKLATRILDASELPQREVVLVTDFQRSGWNGGEAVRLPSGTVLTRVDLSEASATDVAVARVDVRRGITGDREMGTAAARIVNRGTAAVGGVSVTLEIGGRAVETKTTRIEPGAIATVEFNPVPIPEAPVPAVVRIGADRLTRDDAHHFVLARAPAIPVLIVESPAAPPTHALYLTRALALGADPSFRAEVRTLSTLSAADLRGRAVVVLDDAGFPGGTLGAQLVDYVKNGGGLIVAMGDRAPPRGWASTSTQLVPGVGASPVDRNEERGGVIGYIDHANPVFEPFNEPRSGDFSAAQIFRYRQITSAAGDRELARFDDGRPALVERTVGRGRVLIWASSLDNVWSDLPVQPVFLPFVHELLKYGAGYVRAPLAYTVGQPVDIGTLIAAGAQPGTRGAQPVTVGDGRFVAVSPSGKRLQLGGAGTSSALTLGEQGVYEVRPGGAPTARPWLVAANVDPAESDLTRFDPEQLATAVTAAGARTAAAATAEPMTPAEQERRQAAWWYLLVAALLLLGGETVLSNRLSRSRRGTPILG